MGFGLLSVIGIVVGFLFMVFGLSELIYVCVDYCVLVLLS